MSAIIFGTTIISFLTLGFETYSRLSMVEGHKRNLGEYFRMTILSSQYVCYWITFQLNADI